MKKYSVTYQGQEYEIRWDDEECTHFPKIHVYETYKKLFFSKEIIKHKKIGVYYLFDINVELSDLLDKDDPNLYIIQAMFVLKKSLANMQEKQEMDELSRQRKFRLENWDGVIE